MSIASIYTGSPLKGAERRSGSGTDVDARIQSLKRQLQKLNMEKEKAVQGGDEEKKRKLEKQIQEIEKQIEQLKQQEKRKEEEGEQGAQTERDDAAKRAGLGVYVDTAG